MKRETQVLYCTDDLVFESFTTECYDRNGNIDLVQVYCTIALTILGLQLSADMK